MSGIYGIYRYDGAPVDPAWLERMRAAMAYYGPDGGNCTIDGPVGMGHLLLEINPEDVFEKQPARGERGLSVSAARLDNRDDLLEAFRISSSEAMQTTDGRLASLAFDRWGEEVCSHLQGDWALVGWDKRERRLLLARDACGDAALYYYEGKGFIAFASSLKALLALPGVVKEPDRLRLAQVLVSADYDAELTAYKGFRRLVSAHAMAVDRDGHTRTWRHWSPEGREPIVYRRDEEYEEAFLEHYTRAVKSCLRTQKPVAAQLSGGRDSGSVVALAAPLLASQGRTLTAYTSVPCFPPDGASKFRIGNEWELAHATATMAGSNVNHIPIDAANIGVIQGIEHHLDMHDGPTHAALNQYWLQAIYEACSEKGIGVLLVGDMGNNTVSWQGNGSAYLALLQGKPAKAFRFLRHAESTPWLTFKRQLLKPFLTPALVALRRSRLQLNTPLHTLSAINLQFASKLGWDPQLRGTGCDPASDLKSSEDGRFYSFSPASGIGAGQSSEAGARHRFCLADPTINLRLVEFLLRVPDDQFCIGGQRSLLRRSFQNSMPKSVLSGPRRGLQAADAGHRVLLELDRLRDCLHSLERVPEAREILDLPRLHHCLEDLLVKVNPNTTVRASAVLLRGLGVGLFLRELAESRS